jgi:hypothetical protein
VHMLRPYEPTALHPIYATTLSNTRAAARWIHRNKDENEKKDGQQGRRRDAEIMQLKFSGRQRWRVDTTLRCI